MDSKIQELTEKIYSEGIQKANAEATQIITQAEVQAAEIEAKAKAEAENILREAQRRTQELRQNTEGELRLYASQMVESVKSTLLDKLNGEISSANVRAALSDATFMQEVILELVKGFDLNKGVVIETAQAEQLRAYFASSAKAVLEKGLEIRSVAGKPTDFVLKPSDGSFKIQIGEAEFIELFKSFLRPQLAEMLF